MSSVYDLDVRRKLSQLRVDPPDNGFDERMRERVRAALAQRAQEARLLELRRAPERPRSRRSLGVGAIVVSLAVAAAALLRLVPDGSGPQAAIPAQSSAPFAAPAPLPQQPAATPELTPAVPAPAPTAPPVALEPTPAKPAPQPAVPRSVSRSAVPQSAPRSTPQTAPSRATVPRVDAAPSAPSVTPRAQTPTTARGGAAPVLRAIPRVDISDPPARRGASDASEPPRAPVRAGSAGSAAPHTAAPTRRDEAGAARAGQRPERAPLRERAIPIERERREAPRFELQERSGPNVERESRGRGRR